MAKKTIFLTFDDGPNGGTTGVLDTLKGQNALATFFLTGSNGVSDKTEKELVGRMTKEGHQLGNHCYEHKPQKLADYVATYGDLTKPAQKAAFKKNLDDNVAHFQKITGDPALNFPLVRLPGDGRQHTPSVTEVGNLGYKHVGWTLEFAPNDVLKHITYTDWQGIVGVAATSPDLPKDKAIVLAHDGHWAKNIKLFAALVKKLTDNDYQFALVPGLAIV